MSDQETNEVPEEEVLDTVATEEVVEEQVEETDVESEACLLYTSPSPRD